MAFADDEAPRPRPRFMPLPLDALGVGELEAYIADLRVEIGRVEADIARKRSFKTAADSFFKTEKGPG